MKNKYSPIIDKLESEGNFDHHVTPVSKNYRELDPDKFEYLPKNVFYLVCQLLLRVILFIFVPFVTFFGLGLKIKGRKNLKAIKGKGAIVVSNHVLALESLAMRQIRYFSHVYYISLQENYFKGIGGPALQMGGILPLSQNIKLNRKLDDSIVKIVNKKGFIITYAEQSLWPKYTKIRPLKRGAFLTSAKHNFPILPVVVLFNKPKWYDKIFGRDFSMTIQVLSPIFSDQNKSLKESVAYMQEHTHKVMVDCATAHYGVDADATHYVSKKQKEA
ncbi:MAG: 1-acyl-sn-glycerol-3-phosphate acyltransferase [Clostridia bacterium]|nr:1-acyl-sn-glycerol-3-phosphate acyltransferase [Clostridia bacterium]